MASHIIFILGTKPNEIHPDNRDLILSDGGDSLVNPGDTVFWVNLVESITSFRITDDNLHSDVFSPDPLLIPGSSNWFGTVRKKEKKGKGKLEETYTICFTQDGQTFSFDPVIRINPK